MIRYFLLLNSAIGLSLLAGCQTHSNQAVKSLSPQALAQLEADAKAHITPFASQLLTTVQSAVKSGGAPQAVQACQLMAPTIAQNASSDGWQVGRTSMQIRNSNNQPNAWETKQLAWMQQQIQQGKAVPDIHVGQVVDGQYRYMQAITIKEPCLACHGQNIAPAVSDALGKAYPNDKATGYSLGELRGAFTLTKPL